MWNFCNCLFVNFVGEELTVFGFIRGNMKKTLRTTQPFITSGPVSTAPQKNFTDRSLLHVYFQSCTFPFLFLLNSLLLCWVHFKSSAIHTVQLLTVAYDKLYGNNIRQPSLKISLQSVSKGKPWKTCSQLIASVVHSQVQNNYETAQGFSFTP